MYNADDAIARIDSYIISVTGAGKYVGDRKLVRIESVERASAVASLLPEAEQPEQPAKKKKPARSRNDRPSGGRSSRNGGDSSGRSKGTQGGNSGGRGRQAKAKPAAEAEPAAEAKSEPAGEAKEPEDKKSVNSGRFGLRRGRRGRGRKAKTDADS